MVPVSGRTGEGLELLKKTVLEMVTGQLRPSPKQIIYDGEVEGALPPNSCRKSRASSGMTQLAAGWPCACWKGDETVVQGIQHYLTTDPPRGSRRCWA